MKTYPINRLIGNYSSICIKSYFKVRIMYIKPVICIYIYVRCVYIKFYIPRYKQLNIITKYLYLCLN